MIVTLKKILSLEKKREEEWMNNINGKNLKKIG